MGVRICGVHQLHISQNLTTHLGIPETDMLHRLVLALIAVPSVFELPVQALAIAFLAEVVTIQ